MPHVVVHLTILFINIFCRNEDRCWIISADNNKVVYLDSESFDLEGNCYSSTSGDRVNIYDGGSGKLIVCLKRSML